MTKGKSWLIGFAAGFAIVSLATAAAAIPERPEVGTSLLVQVFMFATLIAGFVHQYVMKKQERAYTEAAAKRIEEKADRDAAALAAKVEAAAREASVGVTTQATQVAMTLAQNATALAQKVTETAERLAVKVEAGTEKAVTGSEKAYTEANTVNNKIAQLQEELLKIGKSLLALHEHVARTEAAAASAAAAAAIAASAADQTRMLNQKVDEIIQGKINMRMGKRKG